MHNKLSYSDLFSRHFDITFCFQHKFMCTNFIHVQYAFVQHAMLCNSLKLVESCTVWDTFEWSITQT